MGDQIGASIREVTGVVKWFDSRKGFGFIIGPGGLDVLAHYSDIEGDGFRILKDGWTVVFDAELTKKGWKATRVVLPADAIKPAAPTSPPPAKKTDDTAPQEVVVLKRQPQTPLGTPRRATDTTESSNNDPP